MQDKERLHVIQGIVPSIQNLDREGCRFAPRIPWITEENMKRIRYYMKWNRVILYVAHATKTSISTEEE